MTFSIKNLLLGIVAVLTLVIIGEGILSITKIGAINKNVTNEATNWVPSINVVNAMNTNTSDLRIAEGAHIMSTDPESLVKAEADFNATLSDLKANQAKYEPLISSDEERAIYAKFNAKFEEYLTLHERLLQLSRKNQSAEAAALFKGQMRTVYDDFSALLLQDIQMNLKGANADFVASQKDYDATKMFVFVVLGISIALSIGGGFVAINFVARPIGQITDAMRSVSNGNLDAAIPHASTKNEVGEMARTLVVFRDGLKEAEQLRADGEALKKQAEAQQRRALLQMADDFEKSVGGIVTLVSSAATEMQAAASQLSATAQEASAQSVAVSAAAEEAGANVNSVASSAEELGASVNEIARQVEASANISSGAVREADNAAGIVAELNEVAGSIGGVVEMIAGLASQTNLLALNATIESARAGEAGKGFAVVASEVKALAGQTARATTEISTKIVQIQEATMRASTAMQNIAGTIQTINQTSTAIASAVEQQTAATQEIVQAVTQASIGTSEVTSNITGVADAAEQTGAAAVQVLSSSSELAEQAERLHHEMDKFLTTVRAA